MGEDSPVQDTKSANRGYVRICKVEKGFIVESGYEIKRVYLDFDTMVAELKTYFQS